jgi:hypothetical protein
MPRAKDEKSDERLRQLYPDLDEEDLAGVECNLDRYIQVILRIFESLRDPSRAEQLTELLEHVAASDPQKFRDIEARRATRPADAPVPLDDVIEETAAQRPDIFMTLISAPALAYKIAQFEEKRELIQVMTKDWFASGKEIQVALRKPFNRMDRPRART